MQYNKFSHEYWMAYAIKIAKEVKNEVPVSALVVKDNVLISRAVNKTETVQNPASHAEVLAICDAAKILKNWRLLDTILYTTLEPCSMCAGLIINARIPKIVFSAYDGINGACGSKINLFYELEKKIEIIGGILEKESTKIIKRFFVLKR